MGCSGSKEKKESANDQVIISLKVEEIKIETSNNSEVKGNKEIKQIGCKPSVNEWTYNDNQIKSITKIQRFVSKKVAKARSMEAMHWKVFSDLDTIEESEMLKLSMFLNSMLTKVWFIILLCCRYIT